MRVVKVSGLNEYNDRHGKPRRYHRASGTPIDPALTGQALAAEVDRLDKLHKSDPAKAGTLAALLESYQRAPRFMDLKDRTKADYRKVMSYLKPLGGTPLTLTTPGWFAKLRDKTLRLKRAGFTNHMLAMLSSAFKHGAEYEIVTANPLLGLEPAKMKAERRRPNRAWIADERRNVMAAAWAQLRLPFALARFLGIRRGDIVRMPLQAYSDGWLTFRAGKNNAYLRLPVLGELRREVERTIAARKPGTNVLLLCLNSRGEAWTPNGLSVQFAKLFAECRKRGLMGPKGSIHGLRHSIGAELRAAGYSAEDRKLILGHDTDDMAEHYSGSADVTGQLIDMAAVLQGRPKRERKLHTQRRRHA